MNIAIIGGGFTGLTAAYELTRKGHSVTVFEKDPFLGGLAHGWKEPHWNWYLEKAYHHFFTNDKAILGLIDELGLTNKLIVNRPVTASLWHDRMYQLDSPLSLLQFPGLPMIDKVRTGALLAAMKLNPFWQPLEHITARKLFEMLGGKRAWQTIWEPLMAGKFSHYADSVAASWLWARIKKRTPSLCYIEGGFQTLVHALEKKIIKQGGKILTNTAIEEIEQDDNGSFILRATIRQQAERSREVIAYGSRLRSNNNQKFDKVLLTLPTPFIAKLVPTLPASYFLLPKSIPHLHAHVLILETKEPILQGPSPQGTALQGKAVPCKPPSAPVYWLNVTDRTYPFLIVGAHTNFVDKSHYGGNHITYFGNYLPDGHPMLKLSKEQILKKFIPFIKRLNSQFAIGQLVNSYLFIGPHAQPVHELHYSQKAPKLDPPAGGPISNLYIANMDSIYPWDRGTNYAVELGQKAAAAINIPL